MNRFKYARIIPCLLLKNDGLVKTVKFKNPKYIGDPRNAVKIFNDKEVDEIVLLDIGATLDGRPPNFNLISEIASECFMPLSYGGGITSVDQCKKLLAIGVEKVILNSAAFCNLGLIEALAKEVGSQSVVVSIDVRQNFLTRKYEVFSHGGTKKVGVNVVALAQSMELSGAGEIFLNSIDRDGVMGGYDLNLVAELAQAVQIPVVACGGAGSLGDLARVIKAGASAASAGSLFVYQGKLKAVLISFPSSKEIEREFVD